MGDLMIDPFKLLLNEISHELTEKDLQSLIHISGVPGGSQSSIKDGLTLFRYLMRIDLISKEKVGNLRKLLRKIRPRRRDLVLLVDDYIKKEYKTDNVSLVLDDFSQSWEEIKNPLEVFDGEPSRGSSDVWFKIDCAYTHCVCYKFPACYVPLIVLLLLAVIVTAICWYADVPRVSRHINADDDLRNAGVYIIVVECLLLFLLAGLYAWKKLNCRLSGLRGYVNIVEPTVQRGTAPRGTAGEGRAVSAPRVYRESTGYGSYSGPESAVFSDHSCLGSLSSAEVDKLQDV